MSNRHEVEGRTIHPRALKELGEEACIVALGVARDLRSGVIPPEAYDQQFASVWMAGCCDTPCCMMGYIRKRLGNLHFYGAFNGAWRFGNALGELFAGDHPSDPILAADALERYVYDGSETPWTPS